jgi:RES domain-containing protein
MERDLTLLKQALALAPALSVNSRLVRRVEYFALANVNPPNWLHTSGKPQRYNPANVHCIYFSEDASTTLLESKDMLENCENPHQPVTEFSAEISLGRVLDLFFEETLEVLGVDALDLFKNWRLAASSTLTQLIGQAVNETELFSAIRYPSCAAARHNQTGVNFVIFRDRVQSPDFVRILGPTKKPLQEWPCRKG